MNGLARICDKSMNFIDKTLPILNYMPNTNSLHNKHRMKVTDKKSKYTFDGKDNCGGVSYLLDYYLKTYGYECTLTSKSQGNFTSKQTHSFLTHGYFIIDPTYRQMFLPDYSEIDNIRGDDEFHKYLFEFLPMTFIGTFDELVGTFNDANNLHKVCYGRELKSNLEMWQDGIDESRKSDFDKVVDSLIYATNKGPCYMKLHCMMHHGKIN